jgi:flavin reductase (DIM6/NTAB) family NADH-FMN oxidoreductase RutF
MTVSAPAAISAAPVLQAHPAAASIDGPVFRQALSRLASGVSVITTVGRDGERIGLTATAITSLSADPPLMLACIGNWSRAVAPLQARAPFIIHLLAAEQQQLAQHFATSQPDKFAGLSYTAGIGGCPRLSDALVWIECAPHQVIAGGDHLIVIGRVASLTIGADDRAPLIYFQRQFGTLR